MKFKEYLKEREVIIEEMIWVGSGTKEQAEEGFELMGKMSRLNKKFLEEYNE